MTKIVDYGIVPSTEAQPKNYCMRSNVDKECNDNLLDSSFKQLITDSCIGKDQCDLKALNTYVNPNAPAKCKDVTTIMFIQMACQFDEVTANQRQIEGLAIGCVGVFIALFFVLYVDYMRNIAKNNFVEWDVKTITAGDYSVELDISQEMFNNFCDQHYNSTTSKKTKVEAFRDHLTAELQRRLSEFPSLGYEETNDVKIAQLVFAFDNAGAINLLRKRGTCIKTLKFDQMRRLDSEIQDFKEKNFDSLTRPVTAFITFENEEGLNRAIQYDEIVNAEDRFAEWRTLYGCKLEFDDASEPTDIIWENRHFTSWDRLRKTIVVVIAIGILLACSFLLIFIFSKQADKARTKYPVVNCDAYTGPTGYGDALKKFAIEEWAFNQKLEEAGSATQYIGAMQCFCTDAKKPISYGQMVVDSSAKDSAGNPIPEAPICDEYKLDFFLSKMMTTAMSFVIVIINTILRMILIGLIKYIGEDTHSA